jgi:hypothetical protein
LTMYGRITAVNGSTLPIAETLHDGKKTEEYCLLPFVLPCS